MDIKNLLELFTNNKYYKEFNLYFIIREDNYLRRYYINFIDNIIYDLIFTNEDVVYKCIDYIIMKRNNYYLIVMNNICVRYLIKANDKIQNFIYRKLREVN